MAMSAMQIVKSSNNFSINIRIWGHLVTIPYQTAFQNKVLTNIRITMGGPAARASQDLDSDVDICLHLEVTSTTSESGVFW